MNIITKMYRRLVDILQRKSKIVLSWIANLHLWIPRKLVVKFLLVGVILGYLLFAVSSANPGEILFFPKLFIENRMVGATSSPEAKQDILLLQLGDRNYSYIQAVTGGDCVKASLAEEQLWSKFEELYEIKPAIWSAEDLANGFNVQYQLVREFDSIDNECLSEFEPEALANLLWLGSLAAVPNTELWRSQFNELRAELVIELEEVAGVIRETQFQNQARLNAINGLFILAQEKVAGEPPEQDFNGLLRLLSGAKALDGVADRVEDTFGVWHPYRIAGFRSESEQLCKVAAAATSPRCNQLLSIWNSIESIKDVDEQLRQGESQFRALYDDLRGT